MREDQKFMREALLEAQKAFSSGEVPVGAVLVHQGRILTRAHNLVETYQDSSAHAEMLCLKEAMRLLGNWRLLGATLYCTLEPCAMCAGAMILSRLERLVWGAPDLRQGVDGSWANLMNHHHPIHNVKIERGVLAEEAAQLMRLFFKERRCTNLCLTS